MFVPGQQCLIVVTFGWGFVGIYRKPVGINSIVLENCHFITNCGTDTDWGRFARNGPGEGAVVNLIGDAVVNLDQLIWALPNFEHELPKTR